MRVVPISANADGWSARPGLAADPSLPSLKLPLRCVQIDIGLCLERMLIVIIQENGI